MATLTRPRTTGQTSDQIVDRPLDSSIPKPFSTAERQRILQDDILDELATEKLEFEEQGTAQAGPSRLTQSSELGRDTSRDVLHEIMPSIVYVQKSCLMTLNNLLYAQSKWSPIVPDRRHSAPSSPLSSMVPAQPTTALQTLLSNLRNQSDGEMTEISSSMNDTELIDELRSRVDGLATSLQPGDARLAQALVSLLSHFNRISIIQSTSLSNKDQEASESPWNPSEQPIPSSDIFDMLRRQLSELQVERQTKGLDATPTPGSPPVLVVESALLWARIDEELETVLSLCRERTEMLPRSDHPPQYDLDDYQYDDDLPEYEYGGRSSMDSSDTKSRPRQSIQTMHGQSATNEKMRLDLEAVTVAIDRLYLVAPQLHNQRVELKSSKLEEMEKARRAPKMVSAKEGKQKERDRDVKDLENMLDLIGKASERKMNDQSVVLEGGMKLRMERARQRDLAKRDAFVDHLAKHSDAGRFHSQDAVLQPPRIKDPNPEMTISEFLRESHKTTDSEALLSLPEFVREPIPDHVIVKVPSIARIKKKSRSRSMSAPSLSWLRPSSRSSNLSSTAESKSTKKSRSRPGSSSAGNEHIPNSVLDVHYVAEHHENLNHVLVFLSIPDVPPGADIRAEVVPALTDHTEGDHFIVSCGSSTSQELDLPVRTVPGRKELNVQSAHFELKLTTPSVEPQISPSSEPIPLLDASQLSASKPTSFVCASCSLPLVQSSKISSYRDLPSEHWEELVDAWMCHADQTLHEHISKHGRGFWPDTGQALVGGSYILFEESSVVKSNLCPAEQPKRGEDWHLVRCICGAVTGRCQEHQSDAKISSTVYRLVKYAIRPVSPFTEASRVPLSAFIVEDMSEFVHAHATYRFIISDEEDERPRLLVWLFKPSIRLAYTIPKQYALPKSGSIHAAKVLFKLLGPSTASTDMKSILNKYPGFPQAEYLFYPIDVCRRLASLLKESNTAYPESMRTMTGLDVGWLHRA